MIEFFVNNLFDGFILLALPLSILAGLISFISPCVLPLVPGYLAYAAGFSQSRGRVLLGSSLFVLGFSALFVSYGVLFGGLGARVSTYEEMITHLTWILHHCSRI
jgi:cytochrome c-type biogenesis protein